MAYILKNGSVYINGAFEQTDLLVKDGVIAKIGSALECGCAEVIDLAGKTVMPGLVDLHVHLREPGFEYKETVESGTKAAAAGGFTTVCPMPNLNPVPDSLEHLKVQLEAIEKDAVINVLPFASITVGEKGQELSAISELAPYVIGFSDDGKGVQKDEMMEEAMKLINEQGSFISAHCEDESLLEGGSVHKGEFAALMGLKGISSASEYVPIERDIKMAEKLGARYHICHISAKESIEYVRQGKARGVKVTCEVTPHHIAMCDMDIKSDDGKYKMNPPLRSREDRLAIFEGLKDGTIDCIATDHAPHSAEEKSRGLEKSAFGIVGSETAFAVCYTELVRGQVLTLPELCALMTEKPAAIIGRKAVIAEGERADIAVFDLEQEFTVDPDQFVSKGKSTPFEGMKLYGRTELTLCGGNIVYRRK